MKTLLRHFLLIMLIWNSTERIYAQIPGGTYNIPGDYNTLAEAFAALNSNGISGNVIINMLPNNPETAPNGGFQLGSATLNATLSSTRTLTIRGNGNKITAHQCSGCVAATPRGVFILSGVDYVVMDSLEIADNPANTATNARMNWGIALVKLSATDGCQNVRIQRCKITLSLANTNATVAGIYGGNHLAANTSQLTITTAAGTNSNNSFVDNEITARRGIMMTGYNAAANPSLYDQNNLIYGNVFHFGVGTANNTYLSAGVNVQYQHKLEITNNRFDNLDGATVIANSPSYGIYFNTTDNVDFTCRDNVFELSTAHARAALQAIHSRVQGNGSVTYANNIFRNFSYTNANGHNSIWSDATVFIEQLNAVKNLIVTGNEAVNNRGLTKTGQLYMIRYGSQGGGLIASLDSVNARITGNKMHDLEQIVHNPALPTSQQMLEVIFISNEVQTNGLFKPGKFVITDNEFTDISLGMGNFWAIQSGDLGVEFEIARNLITRITAAGEAEDIVFALGRNNLTIRDNIITDITHDGGMFKGISMGVSDRYFDDWGNPVNPPISGAVNYCYNNLISNITLLNSSTGGATGIRINGGRNFVYNNFITDLIHNVRINGIDIGSHTKPQFAWMTEEQVGHTKSYIYNNTIKIGDATPLSGVSAIGIIYSQRNDTTVIKNNIVHVNATGGSFYHVACIKGLYSYQLYSSIEKHGAPGVPPPAGLDINRNVYYVPGGPNTFLYVEDSADNVPNHALRNGYGIGGIAENVSSHLFNDPGFNTGCSGYKQFIGNGRDQGSYWQMNLTAGAVSGTYVPSGSSYAEGNAVVIANPPITTDYAGVSRGSAPDIGALQFIGTVPSGTPPTITITQPMPLVTYCTDVASVNAHITAAGGLNTTTGTAPRLYYKKASETNAFGNYPAQNNSSFNGWKYVEAIGTPPNFTFNIDYAKLYSPIAAGDSITYFVVAQDNAAVPNVAVNIAGFSSGCNLPSVNLDPSIGATTVSPVSRGYRILALPTLTATAGQSQYCMNGVAHLRLASLPQAAIVQWQEDRGTGNTWYDIPGANGIDYISGTLISSNSYRAVIRCNGVVVATSNEVPVVISSTLPPSSVFPGGRCGPGEVTLRATSAGHSIIWYETLTGGSSIHKGDTLVIPSLAASKDYYVSSYNTLVSGLHVGVSTPGAISSSNSANYGLRFDALNPFIIDSVTIYPVTGSLGDVYIKLKDASGTVIQSKTLGAALLQLNVANRIHLDFHVPAGVDFELVMDGPNGVIPSFSTQPSNVGYPREAQGIVTIKEGVGNPYIWLYFFDWVISTGCESVTRTPVRATIDPAPAIIVTASKQVICDGETTTLNVTSGNSGYTYEWTPGNLMGRPISVSPSSTTVYYVNAIDNSAGVFKGCSNTDSIEIVVNPRPVSFFNHTGNTIFCYGADSVLLEAAGAAGSYQWLLNGSGIAGATAPDYLAKDSGSYRLVMQDGACADTSGELIVTAYSLPEPVIVMNGSQLQTSRPYNSYQWYWNGQSIPGATSSTYNVIQDGKYTVVVEDGNGCSGTSSEFGFALGVESGMTQSGSIHIYPNPTASTVFVDAPFPVKISINSTDGKVVIPAMETNRLDLLPLSDGVYMIRVEDAKGSVLRIEKLVKMTR